MQEYRRIAVVAWLSRTVCRAKPLALIPAQEAVPSVDDLRDVVIAGDGTAPTVVINYTGYYMFCPHCMKRFDGIAPPDSTPPSPCLNAQGELSPAGFCQDLLPCPECFVPSMRNSVLVSSDYRGAVFLHPSRRFPDEHEKQVKVVDFGLIRLPEARVSTYRWQAEVRAEHRSVLGRMLGAGVRMQRVLLDDNGEFMLGEA